MKCAKGYSSTNASAQLSMSSTEAKPTPADAFTSSSARHGTVGETSGTSPVGSSLPPAPEPIVQTTSPLLLLDCNMCVSRGARPLLGPTSTPPLKPPVLMPAAPLRYVRRHRGRWSVAQVCSHCRLRWALCATNVAQTEADRVVPTVTFGGIPDPATSGRHSNDCSSVVSVSRPSRMHMTCRWEGPRIW